MTFDPGLTQRIVRKAKSRIVPNWRSRLTDYSTIMLGLSAAIVAAWSTLPADWMAHLPTEWVAKGTGLLSLAGLVGKFLTQPGGEKT
jgi:hypothetical protein